MNDSETMHSTLSDAMVSQFLNYTLVHCIVSQIADNIAAYTMQQYDNSGECENNNFLFQFKLC